MTAWCFHRDDLDKALDRYLERLQYHAYKSDAENLKAMCQRCHLAYDAPHHHASRRAGRACADLFDGLEAQC